METNEKLLIIFVIIALCLVIISMALINSPIEKEKESCLNAGYSWDDIQEKCIKWGKPIYCSNVYGDVCNTVYQPVCGWFDTNKIRCVKYPCAKTFSNDCFACANDNVLYYTQGECPG